MRPARHATPLYLTILVGVGLIVGRLLPPLAVRFDGSAPRPTWAAAVILGSGAVIVGVIGWSTWQALHKKKQRVNVDRAIQLLALAKSCIMVGGVFAGGYIGFALAFVGDGSPGGHERLIRSLAAGVAAVLLLLAALFLEWACRLPQDDDEDKDKPRADPSPA